MFSPRIFVSIAVVVSAPAAWAQNITLTQISTPFNQPVGIDHHEPTNSVVVSVNYPAGQPRNFERILVDGTHVPFSNASGLTEEVKIATIKSGGPGGFTTGDLFTGNGVDGQITRITDGGATIVNPWASLPGSNNGLMRGGLYHDRTGVFGGDLIVVTTTGQVWRVNSAGGTSATPLAVLNTHLEGVVTVPNDVARYGPIAGKIITGAEDQGRMYAIDAAGNVTFFSLGVNIEDIDHIVPNANFYGVNFGSGRILGAPAAEFAGAVGDILLTQESHSGSGLYRLRWDGVNLTATQLGLASGSEAAAQWEHVTFSPAGITPIQSFPGFDPPSPCGATLMASVGVPLSFVVAASDPDQGDVVTLAASGTPAGATFTPGLPTSGNPVSSTFQWVPTSSDIGTYTIVVTATDAAGHQTECPIQIITAECYLVLGRGGNGSSVVLGGHAFATQMSLVRSTFPVTMVDMPSFPIFTGYGVPISFSAEVVMHNPFVFPSNPDQWSHRLRVTIEPGGQISSLPEGTSNGISISLATFIASGGQPRMRFPFTIAGM